MAAFVDDFIDSFFQAEQVEGRAFAVAFVPFVGQAVGGQTIGIEKGTARLLAVARHHVANYLLGVRRAFHAAGVALRHGGRVVEGTQHAGDVLERAVALAALFQ